MTLTKEDIINLILAGKPTSIVRYGDGESVVLNALKDYASFKLASDAVIKRQLGFDVTVKQVEEIRHNLVETYSHCNVIGVSMHAQKVSDHWKKSGAILDENVPIHTNRFCDVDLAYQMLKDDSYDRLLQNRKVLNYISCRDLDEGFKARWNIGTINKYLVSPEAKWTSGYVGDPHYPDQFNKCQRWMDVVSERHPGSLLFVGAGVIGKIYCNWWRDRGGVAFDVGGVADCWAGRVTRGPERGLDKEDLTYKL